MKRVLLATCLTLLPAAARSADQVVPVVIPQPTPVAANLYSWTGSYLGANVGYSLGDSTARFTFFPETFGSFGLPATTALRSSGVTGGGEWGYNHQIGRIVVGTASDLAWIDRRANVVASGVALDGTPLSMSTTQKLDWFGSSRVRLGITPIDRLLVYGTGGVAYGHVTIGTGVTAPGIIYANEQSRLQVGWTAGGGAEYAITGALSAKLEYLYYDLGGATVVGLPTPFNPPVETHTRLDMTGHMVRAGLNYKINWTPPWSTLGAPGSVAKAPYTREFVIELGARYWYSTGRTSKDLFDLSGTGMVSRLTYGNLTAHTEESFVRADHWSGAFVKGYLGIGPIARGNLEDEDFPPVVTSYSATSSDLRDGALTYGSVDAGYNFIKGPRYKVGAFMGYHYEHETLNAYGCGQTGANLRICNPPTSDAALVISNDGVWHSLRLGLNGELMVTDRLKISADAAWLPYTVLSSSDTHWLRLNQPTGFSGSIPENGSSSRGFQLESVVTYQVTEAFSLGAGARYWRLQTFGSSQFDSAAFDGAGLPQPVNFKTERYGGFVQASVRF